MCLIWICMDVVIFCVSCFLLVWYRRIINPKSATSQGLIPFCETQQLWSLFYGQSCLQNCFNRLEIESFLTDCPFFYKYLLSPLHYSVFYCFMCVLEAPPNTACAKQLSPNIWGWILEPKLHSYTLFLWSRGVGLNHKNSRLCERTTHFCCIGEEWFLLNCNCCSTSFSRLSFV